VSTAAELKEGLSQFSNFFSEPALTVFGYKELQQQQQQQQLVVEIEYQISFWYPMLWRPRIIIPGKAIVTVSRDGTTVTSVSEKWETNVMEIFLKQFFPRVWDVWHVFSSPSPEYPPIKELASLGKVSFVELPQTVAVEARWTGPAKFPGPPLLVLPGFALFGKLQTSKPNRDPFYTVLPVESSTEIYVDAASSEEMKRSTWSMHVPTSLQEKVQAKVKAETTFPLISNERRERLMGSEVVEEEDDLDVPADLSVSNLDNINVMRSITGGKQRGNFELDEQVMDEFARREVLEYQYRILPKRIAAQVDIKGEADSEKISEALKLIKAAVGASSPLSSQSYQSLPSPAAAALGARRVSYRDNKGEATDSPLLKLQLWGTKACFNPIGEPAMAIYEIQYQMRLTKVTVELVVNR